MFLLQLNSSTECHLWEVCKSASLSVRLPQSEEAKGKRTVAMCDISCAHFHGVTVRGVFVELPDEERKHVYGMVDASARWQVRYGQILKGHSLTQGLHCLYMWNGTLDCLFMVKTSWSRWPLVRKMV